MRSVYVVPGSAEANERAKFEQFPNNPFGPPGNPYVYRPFPKMVYRAQKYKGRYVIQATVGRISDYPNPQEYGAALMDAERFNESCQLIVKDEAEYQRAMEAGYRETPAEALEHIEEVERKISTAAAERAYRDQHMSEAAQAEAREFEESTPEHVAEIPEKRKRGRPRKEV